MFLHIIAFSSPYSLLSMSLGSPRGGQCPTENNAKKIWTLKIWVSHVQSVSGEDWNNAKKFRHFEIECLTWCRVSRACLCMESVPHPYTFDYVSVLHRTRFYAWISLSFVSYFIVIPMLWIICLPLHLQTRVVSVAKCPTVVNSSSKLVYEHGWSLHPLPTCLKFGCFNVFWYPRHYETQFDSLRCCYVFLHIWATRKLFFNMSIKFPT